jgi:hypothetical protein
VIQRKPRKWAFSRSRNKWFYERRRSSSSGTVPMPRRSRLAGSGAAVPLIGWPFTGTPSIAKPESKSSKFIVPVGDAGQQEVDPGGSNREAGTRPASGAAALSWVEEAGSEDESNGDHIVSPGWMVPIEGFSVPTATGMFDPGIVFPPGVAPPGRLRN